LIYDVLIDKVECPKVALKLTSRAGGGTIIDPGPQGLFYFDIRLNLK